MGENRRVSRREQIRVLIVDDSALVRKVLSEKLKKIPEIELLGTAPDPYIARNKIVYLEPDVILLDIQMPRMDGLTFLRRLMRHFPTPVVIVSSVTPEEGRLALEALRFGAVDVVCKPKATDDLDEMMLILVEKIKAASKVRLKDIRGGNRSLSSEPRPPISLSDRTPSLLQSGRIIAVGASTGGTEAIRSFLSMLPSDMPPVVIVQHMPEEFTLSFAESLNETSIVQVREAEDRVWASPGNAYIAPGNRHLLVQKGARGLRLQVKDGPLVSGHRPSVDVLFKSTARAAGSLAVGVLMTGMGKDGAQGLRVMREAGGETIAQDEDSCLIYGMPKEGIALDAARIVLPLDRIASHCIGFCKMGKERLFRREK